MIKDWPTPAINIPCNQFTWWIIRIIGWLRHYNEFITKFFLCLNLTQLGPCIARRRHHVTWYHSSDVAISCMSTTHKMPMPLNDMENLPSHEITLHTSTDTPGVWFKINIFSDINLILEGSLWKKCSLDIFQGQIPKVFSPILFSANWSCRAKWSIMFN